MDPDSKQVELIETITAVYNGMDQGEDVSSRIERLKQRFPDADVEECFRQGLPRREILERLLRPPATLSERLTKEEMVSMVYKVLRNEGNETEIDEMIARLIQSTGNANMSDLIYWPPAPMSPEEIIEAALRDGTIHLI